jgi:putative flippase GtrA
MIRFGIYIKNIIEVIIEWLYPYFKRFMPKDTFLYAFCGGANTVLDIFLYYITFNFILQKQIVELGFIAISAHIASFFIVFPITFSTGFLMAKYITFSQSLLRGRIQLFRYFVTVAVCIILNYIFLKIFVDFFGIYPTISKILTTVLVTIYSYFSQKYFTFKMKTQKAV